MKSGKSLRVGVVSLTLSALAGIATAAEGGAEAAADAPASGYLGEQMCRLCHRVEAEHWDGTIHASVFKSNPRNALEEKSCEACHGPGAAHMRDPSNMQTIIAFTRGAERDAGEQNGVCLQCHLGGDRFYWIGSTHETRDLTCSDCHNPMSKMSPRSLLREVNVNQTCFKCHTQQRLQFKKRSHMPLLEGKIDCADCHNPHGSVTDPLLAADSVNQLCYQCHAEKRGPFIWEHAPVTENCLNCHQPHGSNRRNLLTTSIPFLCQQCHAQVSILNHQTGLMSSTNLANGLFPDERIMNSGCVNCHSKIHGSNHPSGARLHR